MIPDEVAKLVGKTDAPIFFEIEKGAIRKYVDAIDDRNPLYWNKEYASNSRYGSIIAPPGYFGWPVNWSGPLPFYVPDGVGNLALEAMSKAGFPFMLDGGVEFEFMLSVCVGDILVGSRKLAEVTERESKGAKMFFIVLEDTFANQDGAVACKQRQTFICR